MENIDPVFILQPAIVVMIATALMLYWRRKRHFHLSVWLFTLLAYAGAIALKYVIQIPTYGLVKGYFGSPSIGLGVYLGIQTVVLEVGLAYAVAWWAVSHSKLSEKDAEAYGSGLGFWENAVLFGILPLINLVSYYTVLSTSGPLAEMLYSQLNIAAPGLFAPASQALPAVALGTLERFSSILIHVAWGYLCIMAVIYRRKWLFAIALPMGLIDFLVPFAGSALILFEVVFLALSLLSVAVAWFAVRYAKKETRVMDKS